MNIRIKELRLESGLTTKKLAEQLGVPPNLVKDVESGKRKCKLNYAIRCADFFNVPIDYIVGLTDQKTKL